MLNGYVSDMKLDARWLWKRLMIICLGRALIWFPFLSVFFESFWHKMRLPYPQCTTCCHIQCRKTLIYIIQPNYITKKQMHTFSNHVASWRQDDFWGDVNGRSLNPTFSTHDLRMRKLTNVSFVIESFILTVKLKAPIRTSTGDATRIINPTTWSGLTCVLMTASVSSTVYIHQRFSSEWSSASLTAAWRQPCPPQLHKHQKNWGPCTRSAKMSRYFWQTRENVYF